jgi:hypothetical protein
MPLFGRSGKGKTKKKDKGKGKGGKGKKTGGKGEEKSKEQSPGSPGDEGPPTHSLSIEEEIERKLRKWSIDPEYIEIQGELARGK